MTTQTQQPQPEQPKKVIVLISNGRQTAVNPEWQLAQQKRCCNCNGRKCVLCSFRGEYHD